MAIPGEGSCKLVLPVGHNLDRWQPCDVIVTMIAL